MTTKPNMNGPTRKTLASQLDRLDGILDGLAEALNQAVAAAVRDAVVLAVREAVRAAAAEALAKGTVRQEPQEVPAAPSAAAGRRGVTGVDVGRRVAAAFRAALMRARAGAAHCRSWLGGAGRRVALLLAGLRTGLATAAGLARRRWRMLAVAGGVGLLVAVGSYWAGPAVASAVSGLAGFVGSLALSAQGLLRRVVASRPA